MRCAHKAPPLHFGQIQPVAFVRFHPAFLHSETHRLRVPET
jgi:hypothetical protein